MGQLKALVIVVIFAAAFARNVDRPRLRRRAPKMTQQWRQESGAGSFKDVGTAGGNSITKPKVPVLECTQEGYFPQPGSCTDFYRCVDWLGNGAFFSTFRFNCPYGTVFDDDLDICNHPGAVKNPAECSGAMGNFPLPEPPGVDSTTSPGGQPTGSGGTGTSTGVGDDTEPCNGTLAPYPTPETTTTTETTTLLNVEETTALLFETTFIGGLETTVFPPFETTTAGNPGGVDENGVFTCPAPGYYPYQEDCLRFYKCVETDDGTLRELLYKCPTGYGYSAERKRCWKLRDLAVCTRKQTGGVLRVGSYTQLRVEDLIWFFDRK